MFSLQPIKLRNDAVVHHEISVFFCSSFSARNEFIRTIRNTIRDSVRKMSLPAAKITAKSKQTSSSSPGQSGLQGTKRPDNLPGNHPPWSLGKKKGKQLKAEMVRHSMDIEDKMASGEYSQDFRTRSRTFSDLNNMDLNQANNNDPYQSGSQSTIASERGAAKLLHSSNNPVNYSSTNIHKDSLGSPIWKPRHTNKKPQPLKSPLSKEERALESTVFTGSAYSDYSSIVYDEKHSAVVLTPPNTFIEHDTEC